MLRLSILFSGVFALSALVSTDRSVASGARKMDTVGLALSQASIKPDSIYQLPGGIPGDRDDMLPFLDAFYETEPQETTYRVPPPVAEFVDLDKKVSVDKRLQVPTFLWANRDSASLHRARAETVEATARNYLKMFAPAYGMTDRALEDAKIKNVHDIGWGSIVVKFYQKFEGVEVFRKEQSLALTRALGLVSISGNLSARGVVIAATGDDFVLLPEEAAAKAFENLSGYQAAGDSFRWVGTQGDYQSFNFTETAIQSIPAELDLPTRVKKTYYEMPDRLIPGYYVEHKVSGGRHGANLYYAYVVSAEDGSLLYRHNLTSQASAEDEKGDAAFSYRVWADPDHSNYPGLPYMGPEGENGHPHPSADPLDLFQAELVDPILMELATGPVGAGDPWLHEDAKETKGNNVDAYLDLTEPDGFNESGGEDWETGEVLPGDLRAPLSSSRAFDWTYDPVEAPDASIEQQYAAVTSLFYANNFLHDIFYAVGFDEGSGNAQADNFGRGGLDDDPILAEAQDYSGRDNANMSTPADGATPRMQMYLWSPPPITFDTLFAQVIEPGDQSMFEVDIAQFGPEEFDLSGELVFAVEDPEGMDDDCPPVINGEEFVGKIVVVVYQGLCDFGERVLAAEAEGAVGVIIVNGENDVPLRLGGDEEASIPALSVGQNDGQTLKNLLAENTVTLRMVRKGGIARDSAVDNGVVFHEWAHYLTNRLIGNGSGLDLNQARSLGEGWSDFVSVALSVEEDDRDIPGNVVLQGGYVSMGGYINADWLFSTRRYPVSTDKAKNPLTLGHIDNAVPLPVADGAPNSNPNLNENSNVHNSGEIWAVALWDAYVGLLNKSTGSFDAMQNTMFGYLVAGLKLTPVNPTFLEARDAVLAAVIGGDDEEDMAIFSAVFAGRGMGAGAVAPERDSEDHSGVVESFENEIDVLGSLEFVSVSLNDSFSNCDNDGILDPGETGLMTVALLNRGPFRLESTVVEANSNSAVTFGNGGALQFAEMEVFETALATIEVTLHEAEPFEEIAIEFIAKDNGDPGAPEVEFDASFRTTFSVTPNQLVLDDAERGDFAGWTRITLASDGVDLRKSVHGQTVGAEGTNEWNVREEADDSSNHVWFAPNASEATDLSLVSPLLKVSGEESFVMSFRHRYSFESGFDGAVVEGSTDGGHSWHDLGEFASVGYNAFLEDNDENPLVEEGGVRQIYSGQSSNYPDFMRETFNFGDRLAGQMLLIRFRVGTDAGKGDKGWEIDDIAFSGVQEPPFSAVEGDSTLCDPVAQINLVALTPPYTSETGGAADYGIFLNSSPSSPVTVTLSVDESEVTVEPSSLSFDPLNAHLPQTIRVEGKDDGEMDGTLAIELTVETSSDDADYGSLVPFSIEFLNFEESAIEVPGRLKFVSATLTDSFSNCDNDGILDPGETGLLTVTLANIGRFDLSNVVGKASSENAVMFENDGALLFSELEVSETTSATIEVTLNEAEPFEDIVIDFVAMDDGDPGAPEVEFHTSFKTSFSIVSNQLALDNAENGGLGGWIRRNNVSGMINFSLPNLAHEGQTYSQEEATEWSVQESVDDSSNHVWFAPNPPYGTDLSLESPLVEVRQDELFEMTFRHRYSFEEGETPNTGFDGGVVEASTDGGQSWFDLGEFAAVGYNAIFEDSDDNPLVEEGGVRPIYGNESPDYPEFTEETYDFGGRFAGQLILIRFRVGTDSGGDGLGWEIDDIAFSGVQESPFSAVERDSTLCDPVAQINLVALTPPYLSEIGGAAEYRVFLNSSPSSPVTVALSVDESEVTVEPSSLSFDPLNAHLPQTIRVEGKDDGGMDGTLVFELTVETSSADADYGGLTPLSIELILFDGYIGPGAVLPALAGELGPDGLMLFWSDSTGDYILQTATRIPGEWTDWKLEIDNEEGLYSVIVATDEAERYFRLFQLEE